MNTYNDFMQQLDVRSRAYSDTYQLRYLQAMIKNLILTVPGVEERIQEERAMEDRRAWYQFPGVCAESRSSSVL